MRFAGKSVVAAVVAAFLCATFVQAQQPERRRGRRGGFGRFGLTENLYFVARIDAVQKEIKASDKQQEAIAKLGEELRPERGERPDFRNMSDEERREFFAEMRERRQKAAETAEKKLAEILEPKQMERLRQISLQTRGTRALSDPKVQAKLKMTDQQKEKIAAVNRETGEKMRELFRSGDRDAVREKMGELRMEADENLLAVLNDQQQKEFKEMKGKPFDMPEGALGFGGRGRGGRGQGRPDRPARPDRPKSE